MLPDQPVEEDEQYISSEDSDFAPDAAANDADSDDSSSEVESEAPVENGVRKRKSKTTKRKRGSEKAGQLENAKLKDEDIEDLQFENSGDEEVIEETLKKQRRRRKKLDLGDVELSDDEGGAGGFVKTRRMIAQALEEKKALATTAGSTIDVDALFAQMTAASTKPAAYTRFRADLPQEPSNEANGPDINSTPGQNNKDLGKETDEQEATIMIQRTYKFAGEVQTESKLVARDSAEARLFLQAQTTTSQPTDAPDTPPIIPRRAPKKARRSIFEPATEMVPQRADLHFGVRAAGPPLEETAAKNAKKLNTVEKSKLDWAGFVDREGIKDELEMAGKAKTSYLSQKEFLARVESNREEEARKARLKL